MNTYKVNWAYLKYNLFRIKSYTIVRSDTKSNAEDIVKRAYRHLSDFTIDDIEQLPETGILLTRG